jgi:hypothetical protein
LLQIRMLGLKEAQALAELFILLESPEIDRTESLQLLCCLPYLLLKARKRWQRLGKLHRGGLLAEELAEALAELLTLCSKLLAAQFGGVEAVKHLVTLLLERLELCGNVRTTLPVLLKTLPILLLLLLELLELGFPRLALFGSSIQLTLETVQESFCFSAFLPKLGFPVTELLKAAVQLLEHALALRALVVCRKGMAFRLAPFLGDLLQRCAEPLFLGKFSSKALLSSAQRFFCLLELL